MSVTEADRAFLDANRSAAMITVGPDGMAKVARVGVAVVDGLLWSSATQDRVRTARLRHDPRCTLYVSDAGFAWRALETEVAVLDGPDVPAQSLRMFRLMQGKPTGPLSWFGGELDEDAFVATMVAERRIIYEFDVRRSYGLG
jgi:Pyridoxamine 5'-phosphate oxidase